MIGCTVAGLVLGTAGGAGSFYALVGYTSAEDEQFGPWMTLKQVGQTEQSPYSRARVALYGIWGLPPSEVIYFTAMTDESGAALKSTCAYRIEGVEPPARWWSLTAYQNLFYIPNPANRYSLSKTTIAANRDGSWIIRLSSDGKGPNGLALGNGKGLITLSLRLYQPNPGIAANRTLVPLPRIAREACRRA